MKYSEFILTLLVSFSQAFSFAQVDQSLDSMFLDRIDSEAKTPGVAVTIIKAKSVVYKKTFGYANLEYDIPLSPESVFDMASLAKQFTGFAVAQLILDNRLSMETSVVELLPELVKMPVDLKIKHLVHHTSGIRDIGELFSLGQYGEKLTSKEALKILERQEDLNFEVGSECDYSNSNYVLLAIIVERVTDQSFRSWCHENIFVPLEMNNTFANDNDLELIKNRAIAYYSEDNNFSYMQNNGMSLIGSSAIFSTIDDLSKWAIAMQGGSQFDPVFALMTTDGATNDSTPTGYGFGLGIGKYKGTTQIEHTGSTPSGFRSVSTFFPGEELSIIMVSNWGDINLIGEFGKEIVDFYCDLENKEQKQKNETKVTKEKDLTNVTPIQISIEELDRITGEFIFNNEMPITIGRKGADLTIAPKGQLAMPLIPLGKNRFDFPDFQSVVEFVVDNKRPYHSAIVYAGPNLEQHGTLKRVEESEKNILEDGQYIGHYYSEELGMLLKVDSREDVLFISNEKHGEMSLNMITSTLFRPEGYLASSLEFTKNKENKIEGMLLNRGSRLRNLVFKKINLMAKL